MNTHSSPPPPSSTPFFEGGMKFPRKMRRRAIFKKIYMGNQKGGGRGNAKVIGRCNFIIFIFSLLALMVTNTNFRKSSLENLFKKVVPGTSNY